MRRWKRAGAVVLLPVLGSCSAVGGVGAPLDQTTPDATAVGVNLDASLVVDLHQDVDLSNPSDHSIRLLSVSSVPDPSSPTRPEVISFRLAGPDRRAVWSGAGITEKEIGAPLIPGSKAVVPARARADDFVLLVRYSVPRGTRWARDEGLRITYSTDGHTYSSVWRRQVLMCSPKAMGRRFCSNLR